MAISVVISSPTQPEPKKVIKVSLKGLQKIDYSYNLHVREALNGDFLIFDHNDIDIIILKEKNTWQMLASMISYIHNH